MRTSAHLKRRSRPLRKAMLRGLSCDDSKVVSPLDATALVYTGSGMATTPPPPAENVNVLDYWAIYSDAPNAFYKGFADEAFALELSSRTGDFKEGLLAFRERRSARFEGR